MFKPSTSLQPVTCNADKTAYFALKSMSRSSLWKFRQCPRKWKYGIPEETTDAMEFGDLMDCIVLTPDRFDREFAIAPITYPCEATKKDPRTEKPWNWNADYCKEWRETQITEGRKPIKSAHHSEANLALNRLKEDDYIQRFISCSKPQVHVNVDWHDEVTGIIVPFKCLIDLMPDASSEFGDTIGDYKTTANAEYKAWTRQIHSYGLHYQAALYVDAMNAATGLKYKNFVHIIQESSAPFEPTHRMLSEEFLALGRSYKNDLKHYCWCLKTNKWPGFDSAISEPESWMVD